MSTFSGRAVYDRTRVLDAASKARARGRFKKAISLYRRVLQVEPGDTDLQLKIAPLLARTGQTFEAWRHYRDASQSLVRSDQIEQAIALYREAVGCLPRRIEAWENLAKLLKRRGRKREAKEVLLEGRSHFTGRRLRAEAISLLRRARELDPSDLTTNLDLARQLSRADQEAEASVLLDQLAARSSGEALRRIRGAQLAIAPNPLNAWHWLHALLASPDESVVAQPVALATAANATRPRRVRDARGRRGRAPAREVRAPAGLAISQDPGRL